MITPARLRDHATADHNRSCEGRTYSCNCGYDAETERLLRAAATRIEELDGYRERFALKREDEQS